jgi:hypothetical protein
MTDLEKIELGIFRLFVLLMLAMSGKGDFEKMVSIVLGDEIGDEK